MHGGAGPEVAQALGGSGARGPAQQGGGPGSLGQGFLQLVLQDIDDAFRNEGGGLLGAVRGQSAGPAGQGAGLFPVAHLALDEG